MHIETRFEVIVRAPTAETIQLFTPEGEREWAGPNWNPQYLHPAGPARDAAGAVFTIQYGQFQAVWTVVQRDDDARLFRYVYFIPAVMVTTVQVRFMPLQAQATQVEVRYARTSLSPEGEAQVEAMSAEDRGAAAEWQRAIEQYLAARTPTAR